MCILVVEAEVVRHFLKRDGTVLNMVVCIFLRVFARSLQTHSPCVAQVDESVLHIGAVAFIGRFSSSLAGAFIFMVAWSIG
jgi:phosphatidylserine decarboxylase